MKKSSAKKLLSFFLCLLLIGAVFCTVVPTVSAADIKIQNGTGNREPIRISKSFSYRAIINKRASEGWRYVGYIPTKQRGTGHTQELDLIFEKEVSQ